MPRRDLGLDGPVRHLPPPPCSPPRSDFRPGDFPAAGGSEPDGSMRSDNRTTTLPRCSPRSISTNARGAASMPPSTIVSGDLQPAARRAARSTSARNSPKRSQWSLTMKPRSRARLPTSSAEVARAGRRLGRVVLRHRAAQRDPAAAVRARRWRPRAAGRRRCRSRRRRRRAPPRAAPRARRRGGRRRRRSRARRARRRPSPARRRCRSRGSRAPSRSAPRRCRPRPPRRR